MLLAIIITIACLWMPAARAQYLGAGDFNENASGPIYSNPVFEGDARAGDMYYYEHEQQQAPWNDYQLLVQQIEAQNNATVQNPQILPSSSAFPYNPVLTGPPPGGLERSNGQTSTAGVSTSVTGAIIEPSAFNHAPGLVGY
jgi:hypothetical protein